MPCFVLILYKVVDPSFTQVDKKSGNINNDSGGAGNLNEGVRRIKGDSNTGKGVISEVKSIFHAEFIIRETMMRTPNYVSAITSDCTVRETILLDLQKCFIRHSVPGGGCFKKCTIDMFTYCLRNIRR